MYGDKEYAAIQADDKLYCAGIRRIGHADAVPQWAQLLAIVQQFDEAKNNPNQIKSNQTKRTKRFTKQAK